MPGIKYSLLLFLERLYYCQCILTCHREHGNQCTQLKEGSFTSASDNPVHSSLAPFACVEHQKWEYITEWQRKAFHMTADKNQNTGPKSGEIQPAKDRLDWSTSARQPPIWKGQTHFPNGVTSWGKVLKTWALRDTRWYLESREFWVFSF